MKYNLSDIYISPQAAEDIKKWDEEMTWSIISTDTNKLPNWANENITIDTLKKVKEKLDAIEKPPFDCVVTDRTTFETEISPHFQSATSSSPFGAFGPLGGLPLFICTSVAEAKERFDQLVSDGKSPYMALRESGFEMEFKPDYVPPMYPAGCEYILPREMIEKYKGKLEEMNNG